MKWKEPKNPNPELLVSSGQTRQVRGGHRGIDEEGSTDRLAEGWAD